MEPKITNSPFKYLFTIRFTLVPGQYSVKLGKGKLILGRIILGQLVGKIIKMILSLRDGTSTNKIVDH